MSKNLLSIIESDLKTFSKGQKLIANYILEWYDKAAFMTAANLGKTVGVSESTVVRFAVELGYDGYPEMQRAMQEIIRNKLTAVQRMEVAKEQIGDDHVLSKVLSMDIERIKRTIESSSEADFADTVETLVKANKIYIFGARSSSVLASFTAFYFNTLFPNVKQINADSITEIMEQIMRIGPGDAILGISFPRYSTRTSKALQFAKSKGAEVIAITDSKDSPIVPFSNHILLARSDMASFVDSLVAPLSVINALIVAIGLKKKDELYKTFEDLEKIWDEYDIYHKTYEGED